MAVAELLEETRRHLNVGEEEGTVPVGRFFKSGLFLGKRAGIFKATFGGGLLAPRGGSSPNG